MLDLLFLDTPLHECADGVADVLGSSDSLSVKHLTFKLVMLLRLTKPSHSADLASLQLDRCCYKPEGLEFLPAVLAKQSSQGRVLFFLLFHTIQICVQWKHSGSMNLQQPV